MSARSMMSAERGQRLQNTVPSIMHTSREENRSVTPPSGTVAAERAMVMSTKAMVSERRLVLEKKSLSSRVRRQPSSAPSASEPTISSSGSSTTELRLMEPPTMASATPKDTAKITRPTASSSATMGSSRSVSLPLALYCRTTISVAAGAVAAAMAPRVITAGRGKRSPPRIKCSPSSTRSTVSVATQACRMPMTVACLPVCFSWERRNSLPMAKAIKPSATLETTLTWLSDSIEEKPRPGTPSRPSP